MRFRGQGWGRPGHGAAAPKSVAQWEAGGLVGWAPEEPLQD